MIRTEFAAAHRDASGDQISRMTFERIGDDPADDLPDMISELPTNGFAMNPGDEIFLSMPSLPYHVTLGVATHRIRPRTRRRILDRLWPEDAPPPVWYEKAAFILIQHGTCVIRHALTGTLVASLN